MINIQSTKLNPIYFGAYREKTYIQTEKNANVEERNHTTAMMRNLPTLLYVRDYLNDTFPIGTHISEFGCSQGQKPYSLLVLLDEDNADKKYKITGYDSQEIIKDASDPVYKVEKNNEHEEIVFADKFLRAKFLKYFENIPELETFDRAYFKPKKEVTKDLIKFKEGNILNIDKILQPNKSGAIIFQNALYHIIDNPNESEATNTKNVKELFKKISNILPKNGIFVMGNTPGEHAYEGCSDSETSLVYQNDERISVYTDTRIHDYLREAGFKPVFYEKVPPRTPFGRNKNICLPTVWQKV